MECKEIIHLLVGGNHGIFCSSAVDCSVYGSFVLRIIIPDDCCDHSPYINLGRSGGRMAIDGLYLVGVGGVQLLCTGILGQYLAKTYLEVKEPACIPVKGFQ